MSTTVILSLIGGALFVLIAVAVVLQTLEKNNKARKNLVAGLKKRAGNFRYLVDKLPAGFISHELLERVANSQLDAWEQLAQLDSSYRNELDIARQQLSNIQNNPQPQRPLRFDSRDEMQQLQEMLKMLSLYIERQLQQNLVDRETAQGYQQQLQQLQLQMQIDGLQAAARKASQDGKLKLAIHYLSTAIEQCKKPQARSQFESQIQQMQLQISELQSGLADNASLTATGDEDTTDDWNNLVEDDESWKKKNIYD